MTVDELRSYCLSRPGSITEGFPFGDDVLVFKAGGKIFALVRLNVHPTDVNLKCDPEEGAELRERYEAVRPGYHMNKKHWITVTLDGSMSRKILQSLIDRSFDLVTGRRS